jgi:hypothetical protein
MSSSMRMTVDAMSVAMGCARRHFSFRPQLLLCAALYALTVVPRAPNFCALRRVSSNLERA